MRAIVFSRDRPPQLDLLLRSLAANAGALELDVVVLWRAGLGPFRRGYEIAEAEHPEVEFLEEHAFERQVRELLRTAGELVVFFTDDDVLFGRVNCGAVEALELYPDVLAFSLRLGRNTTLCYPHASRQTVPEHRGGAYLDWSWVEGTGDFGYPMSVDGHVLRTADVGWLLGGAPFRNPNHFEGALAGGVARLAKRSPRMRSYSRSRLVSIPANSVTETQGNRFGEKHPRTVGGLLWPYLDGERLNLEALDFAAVDAAHYELPLTFQGGTV